MTTFFGSIKMHINTDLLIHIESELMLIDINKSHGIGDMLEQSLL